MKTLNEIIAAGIKDEDWTYCKAEYAPHKGCKIGMPDSFTPDNTKRDDVKVCYIVTVKFRGGSVETRSDMMFLSDGKFYWYDNLWDEDDEVGREITDEWFIEPIAWIPYRNIPGETITLPVAPFNDDKVPTPPLPEAEENQRVGEAE